jgi:hypothetical protein
MGFRESWKWNAGGQGKDENKLEIPLTETKIHILTSAVDTDYLVTAHSGAL